MDLRGYDFPIHPDYSAYPRAHGGIQLDRRDSYEDDGRDYYSIRNLSLSDDQDPEEAMVPPWSGLSKKQSPRGYRSRSPGSNRHEPKKPSATPPMHHHNPGIDTALRNLDYEVSSSLKMFQALVQCFEVQIEPLRGWAEGFTLDTVWRNMVVEKSRRQRDRERFEGVAARLLGTRVTVKEAVKNAKALKEACHDKYKMERQIRTAKKAILYANGIIDLVERAASERLACKQLVFELEEASCLLDRKKHPWIYGQDATEQQLGDLKQPKSHSTKSKGGKIQRKGTISENTGFSQVDDASGTEKQEEPGDSFENPPDLSQEDVGGNQDGEKW